MNRCCRWMPPVAMPAVYDPARMSVVDVYHPVVVPHVHASHTQYRHHQVVEHRHFYPHTESQTCDTTQHNVNCGCPAPDPCHEKG
ncbi:MAG TPA: CotD family spore coat protein [Bacillales bacterium]|nr:CotD family spore coat protein [Bacillales bacterium]